MQQYGETVVPPGTGKRGRPRKPFKRWPAGAAYATVCKTYRRGRVATVKRKLVHGTEADLNDSLRASSCRHAINTAFVERHNGTDRTYNSRKRRKSYEFSKDLLLHVAVTWWVVLCYNFHHLHRGLRQRRSDGTYLHRTPAMAISLTHQPLQVADILSTQIVGFMPPHVPTPGFLRLRHASGPAP